MGEVYEMHKGHGRPGVILFSQFGDGVVKGRQFSCINGQSMHFRVQISQVYTSFHPDDHFLERARNFFCGHLPEEMVLHMEL